MTPRRPGKARPLRRAVARPARLVQAAAGAALAGAAWWSLRSPAVQRADVRLGDALRGETAARGDPAVVATTDLGSVYAVLAIGGVLAARGRRALAADIVGVGLAAWGLSETVKTGVNRVRPYDRDGTRRLIAPPAGSSFPSGHATVATAWSVVAARHARPGAARGLLPLVGAYVAASRVYVGVHYPTDVIGGVGLGLVLSAAWHGLVCRLIRTCAGYLAHERAQRARRVRQPHTGTRHSASATTRRSSLDWPARRSVKTMGASMSRKPARQAVSAVSTWKA